MLINYCETFFTRDNNAIMLMTLYLKYLNTRRVKGGDVGTEN